MAQPSQQHSDQLSMFESQIRECYGRVTYSHKTHEKCADICLNQLKWIKLCQIALSVCTSGSLLATLIANTKTAAIIGSIFSALLLGLNLYTKNFDLGEIAQKHKDAADQLWNIRESYLSLLTDIVSNSVTMDEIRTIRDQLQMQLSTIYVSAPRTNFKAYQAAQSALKENEEMTFSDDEIDTFLPLNLRKNKGKN